MSEETWDRNKQRINDLWPEVSWTPTEKQLWHDTLHDVNQNWLNDAILATAKSYSSSKPQLKWILKAIDRIKKKEESDAAYRQAKTEIKEKQISDAEAMEVMNRANQEMIGKLVSFSPDHLRHLAKKVQLVLGLQVDVEQPPQTWSRTAVGCMMAAHNRLEKSDTTG